MSILTGKEIKALSEAKSEIEWNKVCDEVKKERKREREKWGNTPMIGMILLSFPGLCRTP